MYGFGDDRNPSNDTVSVMEEILMEYIIDVVCSPLYHAEVKVIDDYSFFSASRLEDPTKSLDFLLMISVEFSHGQQMPRSWLEWRNCCSCKKISNVLAQNSMSRKFTIQKNFDVALLKPSWRKYPLQDHFSSPACQFN